MGKGFLERMNSMLHRLKSGLQNGRATLVGCVVLG